MEFGFRASPGGATDAQLILKQMINGDKENSAAVDS